MPTDRKSRHFVGSIFVVVQDTDPFSGILGGWLYGLSYGDLALPCGLLFWVLFFLVKIDGIDASMPIVGMMYVLFASFHAVLMVLVIPEEYLPFSSSLRNSFIWVVVFVLAGSLRWLEHMRKQRIYNEEKKNELNKQLREAQDGAKQQSTIGS